MSKSWSQYYENTKTLKPSKSLIEAFETFSLVPGIAIDLGCGAGRDTRYLLEKGFNVTAVDKDPAAEKYLQQLPNRNKLKFVCTSFEDFDFGHYDLANAHYALPFAGKENFSNVMDKVISSINFNGLFIGQLFGVDDEWNTPETNLAFCERTDVDRLFDSFTHVNINEVNEEGALANGNPKHWHVFNIIAQK